MAIFYIAQASEYSYAISDQRAASIDWSKSAIWLFAALLSWSTLSVAQSLNSECQCRAPGGAMRDLGTVECVDIVGKRHLVVCDMSTNTPYWRKIDQSEGCPSA